MKKILKVAAFVSLLGFFTVACSKDDISNSEDTELKNVKNYAVSSYVDPYNSANVWDSIGVKHNEILSDLKANRANLSSTDDYIGYSLYRFHERYDPYYTITTLTNSEIRDVLTDSTYQYMNGIAANTYYSEDVKNNILEFYHLLENISDEEDISYGDLKNYITNFEEYIIESSLDSSDKDEVLKITSLARHSFYFWYIELGDVKTTTTIFASRRKPIWKWIVVGVADIAGGVAGATIGSPTGIGAIGGGLAGGVGASAGAASLVDWISPDNP